MTPELPGRHVLAIFVAVFGVIITVNLTLAFQAVSTGPMRSASGSSLRGAAGSC